MKCERRAGPGWLVLIGGGEFSFGETEDADRAWLAKVPADGVVGFLPTASGSQDYGSHFTDYLEQIFSRKVEIVPVYRDRDGRRVKNAERMASCAALYLGGGVADHLLEVIIDTPCQTALEGRVDDGGLVVAIAAAAQSLGQVYRSILGGKLVAGFGLLPGGVVETNFDPGHDRRLRQMMAHPDVRWGLGLPAGAALLLGPNGENEIIGGPIFVLDHPDGDFAVLS